VRSWLLDLLVDALEENPTLDDVSDYTNDSGEGRWTVEEAIANAVPMPVISASLFARFASRQEVSPALQAVAALRGQFGGHAVMTIAEGEKLRPPPGETCRRQGLPRPGDRDEGRQSLARRPPRRLAKRAKAAPRRPSRGGVPRSPSTARVTATTTNERTAAS
jgi:6-phosphogluconate dehydrogenase